MSDQNEVNDKDRAEGQSILNDGLGYWTDFLCPECGSYKFGSSKNTDGTWTRYCHGNELCDYSEHESNDKKHFKTFAPNVF